MFQDENDGDLENIIIYWKNDIQKGYLGRRFTGWKKETGQTCNYHMNLVISSFAINNDVQHAALSSQNLDVSYRNFLLD